MARYTKIYLVREVNWRDPLAAFTVKYEAVYWAEEYVADTKKDVYIESYPDGSTATFPAPVVWRSPALIEAMESWKNMEESREGR